MSCLQLLHALQFKAIPGQGWTLKTTMIIPIQNSLLRLKDFAAVVQTMVLSSQFAESYKGMSQIFTITIKIFFSYRLEKKIPLLVSTYKKHYVCGCFNLSILNFIIFYKDHHDSYVLNQSKQIYKPLQRVYLTVMLHQTRQFPSMK